MKGTQRGHDVFTADSHQLLLHGLGIVHAFDAHLIVDSENDHAAASVGQGDDLLRNFFGVESFTFSSRKVSSPPRISRSSSVREVLRRGG